MSAFLINLNTFNFQIDRTAHKYLETLVKRVSQTCSKAFPDMGTCPPAPPLGSPW